MQGILFGEIFVKQLNIIFVLYSVLLTICPIFEHEETTKKVKVKEANNKNVLKDAISVGVMLVVIFAIMLGMMYWIIEGEILIGAYFIVILSFLFCGIAFFMSVFDFIRYILLKPLDYNLTKEHEGSLWFIGLFACSVCHTLVEEDLGLWIEQKILLMKDYQADAIKMVVLIFWYFAIIFFTLTFLILFIHKMIIICNRFKKKSNNKSIERNKKIVEKGRTNHISEEVWNKIEKIPRKKKWKRIFFCFLWIIVLVCETVKIFIVAMVNMIKDLFIVIVIGLPRLLYNQIKKIFNSLEQNQGKGIIVSSRLSLVGSLLIVYLIDKYQKIFSAEGSEVYEFFCSVIMIPFLITQISILRKEK